MDMITCVAVAVAGLLLFIALAVCDWADKKVMDRAKLCILNLRDSEGCENALDCFYYLEKHLGYTISPCQIGCIDLEEVRSLAIHSLTSCISRKREIHNETQYRWRMLESINSPLDTVELMKLGDTLRNTSSTLVKIKKDLDTLENIIVDIDHGRAHKVFKTA